ncbi:MAG: hypothetical protein EAZ08_09745 [Cytophagales bacterium]|nr:MAG: hypothetical protein EAZ08_09745 [Cytophagales bacterium]
METIAIIISCWLLTYFLHSLAFFGLAKLLAQTKAFAHTKAKEILWKVALCGGLLTASVQVFTGTGVFTTAIEPASVQIVAEKPTIVAPLENVEAVTATPIITKSTTPEKTPENQANIETASNQSDSTNYFVMAFYLWAIIGSLLIIRLFVQKYVFLKSLSPRKKVANDDLLYVLFKLCSMAGIDQKIVLTSSENLCSPLAIGRGEICLPERSFTDLSAEQQQSMLAHELAHIVRKDAIWLKIGNFLETVLFFQPLNRLMRIELHEVTEQRCDEWAIRSTGNAKPLADCLVKVAEWITEPTSMRFASGMALHQSSLRQRVINILKNQYFTQTKLNRMKVITLLAILLVVTTFLLPGKTWLSVSLAHGSSFGRFFNYEVNIGETPASESEFAEISEIEIPEMPEVPEFPEAVEMPMEAVTDFPLVTEAQYGDTLRFGGDFMLITKGNGNFEIYKDDKFIGKDEYEKYKEDFIVKKDNSIEILSKNGIKVTPNKENSDTPMAWGWHSPDVMPAVAPFAQSWGSGFSHGFFSDDNDHEHGHTWVEDGQEIEIEFDKDDNVNSLRIDGKKIDKGDFSNHEKLIAKAKENAKKNREQMKKYEGEMRKYEKKMEEYERKMQKMAIIDEKVMKDNEAAMRKLEKEMQEMQRNQEVHMRIMQQNAQQMQEKAIAHSKKAKENSDKILEELIKDGLIKSKSDHYEMRLNKRGLFIDDEKQSDALFEKYKKLFKDLTGNDIENGTFVINN